MKPPIRGLRWWICGLLLLVTTINYMDRTTLSGLKKDIKGTFALTDNDYADIANAFKISYAVGQMVVGKLIDTVGTRTGFLIAFIVWSLASMAHAFARGTAGFAWCRFALGIGEAGNFPAAIKAVSEWFPKKERALATGILNVGAGLGAMITPWAIYAIMSPTMMGRGWRAVFIVTGGVGLLWVFAWLWLYRRPREHPRLSKEELAHIEGGQEEEAAQVAPKIRWLSLFRYPQVWGVVAMRFFADPVWWFWIEWFQGYLREEHGFSLGGLAAYSWIPFFCADWGSLAGGALATYFAHRCSSILRARKLSMACCASLMPLAILAGQTRSPGVAIALVSVVAFAHQAFAASLLTLPADLFPSRYVGAVFGITAMAGGLGGIVFTKIVGIVATEQKTIVPMFMVAGFLHLIGLALVCLLVRKPVTDVREATATSNRSPSSREAST